MSKERRVEADVICMNDYPNCVVLGRPGEARISEIMDNRSVEYFGIKNSNQRWKNYYEYKLECHWHVKTVDVIFEVHDHQIVEIKRHISHGKGIHVYHILMDCPVNPEKLVVTNCELKEDQFFDPHFGEGNESVLARFPATDKGMELALALINMMLLNK